jgi:hypothetical protein
MTPVAAAAGTTAMLVTGLVLQVLLMVQLVVVALNCQARGCLRWLR